MRESVPPDDDLTWPERIQDSDTWGSDARWTARGVWPTSGVTNAKECSCKIASFGPQASAPIEILQIPTERKPWWRGSVWTLNWSLVSKSLSWSLRAGTPAFRGGEQLPQIFEIGRGAGLGAGWRQLSCKFRPVTWGFCGQLLAHSRPALLGPTDGSEVQDTLLFVTALHPQHTRSGINFLEELSL